MVEMIDGISIPKETENVQIKGEILAKFQQLATIYPHLFLLVDYEGVVLPYNFERVIERKSSYIHMQASMKTVRDPESQERFAAKAISNLPSNAALIDLLKKVVAQDPEKISLTGASELEFWNGSHGNHLPPVYAQAVARGREILNSITDGQVGNLATGRIPEGSLIIFLNDVVDKQSGLPPINLITKINHYQPHFKELDAVSIHIPRFTGSENETGYPHALYTNMLTNLSEAPRRIVIETSPPPSQPRRRIKYNRLGD